MSRHAVRLAVGLLAFVGVAGAAQANGFTCSLPFNYVGTIPLPVNYSGNTVAVPIPSGYRLQLEYVSGSQRLQSTTGRAAFEVVTQDGSTNVTYPMRVATGYTSFDRTVSQPVSLYASSSANSLQVRWYRDSGYTVAGSGNFHLSGCLVKTLKVIIIPFPG